MTDDVQQAATEAAQRVVDEVSSYQYSAEYEQASAPQVRSATPVG